MMRWVVAFWLALPLVAATPIFGDFDGTAVIMDLDTEVTMTYGHHAHDEVNPCSTFKILNSMIALDRGVIADENVTLAWDGVVHDYPAWNHDHTMRSAIKDSVVWFYQALAYRVGEDHMATMVRRCDYGNHDTSKTLTTFWLGGGSLKISPYGQVSFLKAFVKEQLPFRHKTIQTLKEMLMIEKTKTFTLIGKTGSCGGIGWFVGFAQRGDKDEVFAFQVRGEGANGAQAKRIALAYYHEGE